MPYFSLFIVFCTVGLTQSCMPTHPPDPGIPVTRAPMNPEATTQPGTITEAPVTQAPVTEAPITEPPPACQTCKLADMPQSPLSTGFPYTTAKVTVVNGCNQFDGTCSLQGKTCDVATRSGFGGDLGLYVQSEGLGVAALKFSCKDDGLWYGLDNTGNEFQAINYYCYPNRCL